MMLDFKLSPELEAHEPPEARGLDRDQVRLLVGGPQGVSHHHFPELPALLEPGDVLLDYAPQTLSNETTDASGAASTTIKILGSAQRRRRGAVLQHGSLLLNTPPAAPELVGLNDAAGLAITPSAMAAVLPGTLSEALQVNFIKWSFPSKLRQTAEEQSERFASPAWTGRR